jgi:hypothetical protein
MRTILLIPTKWFFSQPCDDRIALRVNPISKVSKPCARDFSVFASRSTATVVSHPARAAPMHSDPLPANAHGVFVCFMAPTG